jgi:hypothetical protein
MNSASCALFLNSWWTGIRKNQDEEIVGEQAKKNPNDTAEPGHEI